MDILKFPNPKLFIKCKPVTVFGPELKVLLESMWETMTAHKGLGLAANQVGIERAMFVMEGPNGEKLFIVNPVVVNISSKYTRLMEGCLSAPGELVNTGIRKESITISYKDETGKHHTQFFYGIHAVCVQHEMEHLEGKSFLQSPLIAKGKRKMLAKKWGLK